MRKVLCPRCRLNGSWIAQACAAALIGAIGANAWSQSVQPEGWAVKEAAIRFRVGLSGSPTHPSAGYFMVVPDGGLLPGPFPQATVVAGGKTIAAYVLWHSRQAGLGIVFESPGGSDADVYVSGADRLRLWTPETKLTPSALVCAQPGVASLDSARALARLGQLTGSAHFRNNAGNARAPLCLQGDLTGRPPPTSFYMLAHVVVSDAGQTWIAPVIKGDTVEVRVDGRPLALQKKSDKFGGTGQALELSRGIHRIEILAAVGLGSDYTQDSVAVMTWKTPKDTPESLGGIYGKNSPYPGQPRQDSRVIAEREIVRSGDVRIREVNLRDGTPAACFTFEPRDVFWFEGETPSVVYSFAALTAGLPTNAVYSWNFGGKANPVGPKVHWFLEGLKEHSVTLTVSSGDRKSSCTLPVFAYSTAKSSLDNASTRESFRMACLSMIRSYPEDADPTVDWTPSVWRTFFDVQELGKGYGLLHEVLVKRWKFFKAKIPQDKVAMLEDAYFHSACHRDPDKALDWLREAERGARDPARRNDLRIMQAEVLMYHKQKMDEAKKILVPLAAQGLGDASSWAMIRLGDIAFLQKDLNEANRCWGLVQQGVRIDEKVIQGSSVEWQQDVPEKGRGNPNAPAPQGKQDLKSLRPKTAPRVDDWKKAAILDTGMATSISALVQQEFLLEAYRELRRWERNFPMSKISSDFIIQEAEFFMAIGNRQRAKVELQAYVDNVDASSWLFKAVELLLRCMVEDQDSDEKISEFCSKMKKRFQFHPLAGQLETMLNIIRGGGPKTTEIPEGI